MRALSIVFAIAPFVFGLIRFFSADDIRMLAMALLAFAGALFVRMLGRSRPLGTFIVATLLAAGTAYALGASAWFGVWAVAVVIGACLAISDALAPRR